MDVFPKPHHSILRRYAFLLIGCGQKAALGHSGGGLPRGTIAWRPRDERPPTPHGSFVTRTLGVPSRPLPRAGMARRPFPSAFASVLNRRGGSPCQEVRVWSCSRPKLRRRETGWRASGGEGAVRNASELDSACRRGEPARDWRSRNATVVTTFVMNSVARPGSWFSLNVKRKLERSGRRGVVGVGTS
jgi:hypothetical protein